MLVIRSYIVSVFVFSVYFLFRYCDDLLLYFLVKIIGSNPILKSLSLFFRDLYFRLIFTICVIMYRSKLIF